MLRHAGAQPYCRKAKNCLNPWAALGIKPQKPLPGTPMTRQTAIATLACRVTPARLAHIGLFLAVFAILGGPGRALAQQVPPPMTLPDIHDYSNTGKNAPPEPQARADGYRLQGRCDVAIPIYRALVNQGTGYELSEFNLGRCLLETARKAPDPASAEAQKREAADWTLKAGNKGLPNAQNGLIAMYLDGQGVAADPVEAGKWSLLYHGNAARRMYGLPDIAPALQARLDSVLNEKSWAQAQARADTWSPAP